MERPAYNELNVRDVVAAAPAPMPRTAEATELAPRGVQADLATRARSHRFPLFFCSGGKAIMEVTDLRSRSELVMIQALLCKLSIRHDRHVEHADDGGLYRRGRRCGKDDSSGGGAAG